MVGQGFRPPVLPEVPVSSVSGSARGGVRENRSLNPGGMGS